MAGGRRADPESRCRGRQEFFWFNRYRVTDGYSTYGGRAWLKFIGGQTNYEVGQRELEYLDVKTANRDRRIWATAATLADPTAALPPVDAAGLPELIPVTTNKPGKPYDKYLAAGYPIGSGVAEGACRHLVKDRMEGTGMRWTVPGSRAMLHLRAVYLNGRWDQFSEYHAETEQDRLYGRAAT